MWRRHPKSSGKKAPTINPRPRAFRSERRVHGRFLPGRSVPASLATAARGPDKDPAGLQLLDDLVDRSWGLEADFEVCNLMPSPQTAARDLRGPGGGFFEWHVVGNGRTGRPPTISSANVQMVKEPPADQETEAKLALAQDLLSGSRSPPWANNKKPGGRLLSHPGK